MPNRHKNGKKRNRHVNGEKRSSQEELHQSVLLQQQKKRQEAFFQAYLETGTIFHAAINSGIARQTHADWMHNDPTYEERFKEVQEAYLELLQRECDRRAVEGWEEPVFYKGEVQGTVRKYDSTLLIFRMKRLDPQYRDRFDFNHSGSIGYREEKLETNVDFHKPKVK